MDGCDICCTGILGKERRKQTQKLLLFFVVVVIIVLNIEWLPVSLKCRLFSGTALSCSEYKMKYRLGR